MKKTLILLFVILFLSCTVSATICQDIIIEGEECQVTTPILTCVMPSYIMTDNTGNTIQSGSLIPFVNQTYYFMFSQGEGEYHVELSCDGWSNTYYVVPEAKEVVNVSYPAIFGIGILLLVVIGLCIFMYFYNKDDIWLQGLSLAFGVVTFIFLIVISSSITEIQMGYSTGFSRVSVGDTDYNSNNISYLFINDTRRYLLQFTDFDDVDVNKFESASLCLKYNNSDSSNDISVYDINSRVSKNYLISNNTLGAVCIDFKASKIFNGVYLGIGCKDCSASNTFGLGRDYDASAVTFTILNQTSGTYTLNTGQPFIYEVRTRYPPFASIKKWFFTYLFFVGVFALMFLIRMVVMYIIKTKEVIEK